MENGSIRKKSRSDELRKRAIKGVGVMENKGLLKRELTGLRKRALEVIHKNPQVLAALPINDIEQLAQELSIYQIQLEMQNDELRNSQVELERSRQEYSDLYDFAPVGYLTVSTKGIIQRANLTATIILGKERAYLVKQPFSKFIIPDDMDTYYLHRRKVLETQEPQECELQIIRQNGNVFWAHLRCCPVTDADGEVTEMRSVITDITERRNAQQKIEYLAKFPSENPNPVLRIARDGKLLYANDGAKSFVMKWDCQVGQMVPEDWHPLITDAFQKGTEQQVEIDHHKNIFSFSIVPVIDAGYANLYGRDITARKQVEAEREQLLKTIQAKNNELLSVVYIASHDLRSPLINIHGFGKELAETCAELRDLINDNSNSFSAPLKQKLLPLLDHTIPESITFINAGTAKMKVLLDALLQISRIGTAKVEITLLDMNTLMNDIHQTLEFQISHTGIEFIVEDLPNCLGDSAMTNQLFSNILGNSLKYMDPKRQGKIHIWGRTENGMSVYCVEDNGIGIDTAYQRKIFEVFHRLNPHDGAGGEGLGLSIVTRILDRLNGHIRVESEAGKGSRFFVSLPTG